MDFFRWPGKNLKCWTYACYMVVYLFQVKCIKNTRTSNPHVSEVPSVVIIHKNKCISVPSITFHLCVMRNAYHINRKRVSWRDSTSTNTDWNTKPNGIHSRIRSNATPRSVRTEISKVCWKIIVNTAVTTIAFSPLKRRIDVDSSVFPKTHND